MTVLETKRLCIRQITNEDAENLAKVLADPVVMQYSTVGVHTEGHFTVDVLFTILANQQFPAVK